MVFQAVWKLSLVEIRFQEYQRRRRRNPWKVEKRWGYTCKQPMAHRGRELLKSPYPHSPLSWLFTSKYSEPLLETSQCGFMRSAKKKGGGTKIPPPQPLTSF